MGCDLWDDGTGRSTAKYEAKLMKTNPSSGRRGFTLIEMIGVIAIIGILATVLVPKVMNAVARSKVNGTALAYNNLRTVVTDYYARSNAFPARAGTGVADTATATGRFDADLVAAGILDKLVSTPIGNPAVTGALNTRPHVRSLAAVSSGAVNPTTANGGNNFDLDANTATADFVAGQMVVSLMIPRVTISEAIQLNKLIDNVENTGNAADRVGRCIYSAAAGGTVTVYLYLSHQ